MAAMFAAMIGESPAQAKARLEDATKNANDLTGLVRKKKPKAPQASNGSSASAGASNGKRKLDVDEVMGSEGDGKRAKTEEA